MKFLFKYLVCLSSYQSRKRKKVIGKKNKFPKKVNSPHNQSNSKLAWWRQYLVTLIALAASFGISPTARAGGIARDFTIRYQIDQPGSIRIIGNSTMTCSDASGSIIGYDRSGGTANFAHPSCSAARNRSGGNSSTNAWTIISLNGGASTELDLTYEINPDATLPIENFAEVVLAFNRDSDSTPDNGDSGTDPQEDDEAKAIIDQAVASDPNLTLVKRITAVNSTAITTTVDDTTDNPSTTDADESTFDNEANWPTPVNATSGISEFLQGDITRNDIQPGDELEYTIYFLSSGDKPITNAGICDMIPANTTYVAGSIEMFINSNTSNLTDADDADPGTFFTVGNTPSVPCPTDNGEGAIVVDLAISPTELPHSTAPGIPTDSYGYIRFRVVVDITAINGNTTTNGDDLAIYNQDDSNPYDDNKLDNPEPDPIDTDKWFDTTSDTSSGFLIGGINGGKVEPDDEIEYTVYFLSAGDAEAKNVLVCDRVPEHVTFLTGEFNSITPASGGVTGSSRGILWLKDGNTESLTNGADGDAAEYFPPGVEPSTVYPQIECGGTNTNGAVVVNLGNLPTATSPGVPNTSYGYIRFRAKVK